MAMAAPAADSDSSTTAATTPAAAAGPPPPLPRAIQLMQAISPSTTTTVASSRTIIREPSRGERLLMWLVIVITPAGFLALPAVFIHSDDVSRAGLGFLAVPVLLSLYLSVVSLAWGHLMLFAPRTPYAAWEALHNVGQQWMGLLLLIFSLVPMALPLAVDQAWARLPLAACAFLLALLVASTVALWLCLLRTYGGDDGKPRGNNSNRSSCGEAVIDGLAYPYARLLYEFCVWLPYELRDGGFFFMPTTDADDDDGCRTSLV